MDERTQRQTNSEETAENKKKTESIKDSLKQIFSISGDAASNEEIRDRLFSGGQITGTNMVVMICAIIIASIGLITNSVAVIIGAMLISPLMGTILAIGYGTVSNDSETTVKYMIGFGMQVLFSVGAATVFFLLCPEKEATEQIIARTNPGVLDVLIAVAGGVAGIVGQTRQDKANNIIPGVAIATALMPPLCTCGFCIANGNWRMLGHAVYLFVINAYFIFVSACIVLSILKIPKVKQLSEAEWRKKRFGMIRNTVIVLLPIIVVVIQMNRGI